MSDAPARTVKQLAVHWQVSERYVYALIAEQRLGHIRVGTLIRVRQQDVDAFEALAWHAPAKSSPTIASSSGAVVSMSAGGRMAPGSAYQRGRKIGSRLPAS